MVQEKNLNIENDDDLGDDNKDDARQANYIRKAFNSDKATEILHYNRQEIRLDNFPNLTFLL